MKEDLRRSARHLLGATAEVHVGASTVVGVVKDVSLHGMGLALPSDLQIAIGDTIWLLVDDIASYAITATVRRLADEGFVGVEFDEILEGDALEKIECLPVLDGDTVDISS